MARVRLTRRGRVQARRVLLDPDNVLVFYFQTCDDTTTYHLASADLRQQRAFAARAHVPEFDYVC